MGADGFIAVVEPVLAPAFRGVRDSAKTPLEPAQGQTILLAEDDDDLRLGMTYLLTELHFKVVACANADLALAAFSDHHTIDLLITDLQMPGRSGVELASELTTIKPDLPVLIVSGSILSDGALTDIWQKGWAFLSKPCKLNALTDIIESLLRPDYPLAA